MTYREVARALVFGLLLLGVVPLVAEVNTSVDQIGRLTSVGNGSSRVFHGYDAEGRVVGTQYVHDGNSWVFSTQYGYPMNPATTPGPGLVAVKEVFPDGEILTYTHDATGEIVAMKSTWGGVTEEILRDSQRNARGQMLEIVLGNTTKTTYQYDDAGHLRLTDLSTTKSSGEKIQDIHYAYDENGNVKEHTDRVRGDHSFTLRYDTLDQLTAMVALAGTDIEGYDYDAIGNLTRKGLVRQEYNAGGRPHALAQSGSILYDYDPNGNVTVAGTTTIEWTVENMAARVVAPSVVSEKAFVGEALWKKSEKGVTTYYLPAVRIENGVLRKYYGSYAERLETPGARQLRFYHPDHLGSSSVMTDHNQVVIRRASYFAYGQDRGVEATFTPRLQFNGKEKDETGFYDYGARLYNPNTGRFLSPDSDLSDGLNRYAYVGNNPWSKTDPSGHRRQDPDKPGQTPAPAGDPNDPCYHGATNTCVDAIEVIDTAIDGKIPLHDQIKSVEYTPPCCGLYNIFPGGRTVTIRDGQGPWYDVVTINNDNTTHVRTTNFERGLIMADPTDPLMLPIPISPAAAGKKVLGRVGERILFGKTTGRILWTQGSRDGAEELAERIGGHTLNQTLAGKGLMFADKYVDWKYMQHGWAVGSKFFARGAQKEIHFTFKDPTKPFGPFFLKSEVPNIRPGTPLIPVKVP